MTASATPPPVQSWAEITAGLFPWMKDIVLSTVSGGLRILAAAGKLHLAGDATDAGALRTSDTGGRLLFDPGIPSTGPAPALYYAPGPTADYAPVIMVIPGSTVGGTVPSLPGAIAGTAVALGPGSTKVTIA